jgi:hypothetical protein
MKIKEKARHFDIFAEGKKIGAMFGNNTERCNINIPMKVVIVESKE